MTTAALAPLNSFSAHDHPVNHVVFGQEGRIMATADTNLTVKVWRDRELVRAYDLRSISDKVRPLERIRGIRFSSDGRTLYAAAGEYVAAFDPNADETEPLWSYVAPRLFAFLIVHPNWIAVSPRDTLAATFENGTVAIWEQGKETPHLIRHNAAPRTIAFLPDDSFVGTDSFSVSLWRADQRKPLWHRPSKDRIYGMAASSDGEFVALRNLFTTHVSRIDDGTHVTVFKQGRGLPLIGFAPGTHVLALGTQHAVELYDLSTGRYSQLAIPDAELISLGFLPDGSQVVAGCSDGRLRTWDNPLTQMGGSEDALTG